VEKLVYVLWKGEDASADAFKAELLGPTARRLIDLGAQRISVNVVDEFAERARSARITKLSPPIAGTLSFWLDASDERAPLEEAIASVTSRSAGYLVVESVPLPNTTHRVPLGQRTPGLSLVSCIEQPEWLSYAEWIDRWHVEHRKVALETQCTYLYVRNTVVWPLTRDAPPWRGIVEEGFPAEALTDLMLWYRAEGSQEKLRRNLERMLESVRGFLDIDRVEAHPMSEYRLTE
jgi:hypothetical protein